MIQHFNPLYGYIHTGASGAAGTTTLATVYDQGRVVRIDSSGKYVVAGVSKNATGGQEIALWRYSPNGSIDSTFGTSGIVTHSTSGAGRAIGASVLDEVYDFQIDSSGNYLFGWIKYKWLWGYRTYSLEI